MPLPFLSGDNFLSATQSASAQKNKALPTLPSAHLESIPEYICPSRLSFFCAYRISAERRMQREGLTYCLLDERSYRAYLSPDPFAIPHCIKFLQCCPQASDILRSIRIGKKISLRTLTNRRVALKGSESTTYIGTPLFCIGKPWLR